MCPYVQRVKVCAMYLVRESEGVYYVPVCRNLRCVLCSNSVCRGRDGGDALVPEAAVVAVQHRHHRLPHGHRLVLVRSL